MNSALHQEISREQGFEVYELRNEAVSLAVIPELGAKVISLKNLRTGREWLWHPRGERKFFRNRVGDDFATSTLVGWDECIPTIAPCQFAGRTLPDHGEAWQVPWALDATAWSRGEIKTSVKLLVSSLKFERTLRLEGDEVIADYSLVNLGPQPEQFLWAMHALLAIQPGDQLELTNEARKFLVREPWLHSLEFGDREPACAKVFAGPLREGRAGVRSANSGDGLEIRWDTKANPLLGIWLTRGGWHGHEHLALEPTNGAPDALAEAAASATPPLMLASLASAKWRVQIHLSSK